MKMLPSVIRRSTSAIESQPLTLKGGDNAAASTTTSASSSDGTISSLQIETGASSSVGGGGGGEDDDDDDPVQKNKGGGGAFLRPLPSSSSSSFLPPWRLLLSTLGWVLFGLCGWYLPRCLLQRCVPSIAGRPVRVQTVVLDGADPSRDVVIVDPLLDEPLVDPPTVDCTCRLTNWPDERRVERCCLAYCLF